MKIRCDVIIEYDTKGKAQTVLRSTKVDDFDFVTSRVKGNRVESTIESSSLSSLIHTLDDYLACVSVAGKIVDKS
jgi:hypothetical protein